MTKDQDANRSKSPDGTPPSDSMVGKDSTTPAPDEATRRLHDGLASPSAEGEVPELEMAWDAGSDSKIPFPTLGDYLIIERLGAGGMGQVYRARHRTMDRDVAVKILPRRLSQQAAFVDRFYKEVRLIAKLMHPNIVTAFDAGCVHAVHYLVMELVEGQSLSAWVSSKGALSVPDAIKLLAQAASALDYAHCQGVVHKDIKPGNMMVTKQGVLKILDFGIAELAAEDLPPEDEELLGTIEYMSPEQIAAKGPIDARSDLYSLGATFFYMLTGRPMFTGEPVHIALAHQKRPAPPLYEVREDLDLRVDSIFQRLVAKEPDRRFESAAELIDELRAQRLIEGGAKGIAATVGVGGGELPMQPRTRGPSSQSTSSRGYAAIGIELGMLETRASFLQKGRELTEIPLDGQQLSLRNMLWSDGEQVAIGEAAHRQRSKHPDQIFFGLQRWYGLPILERPFGGRRVTPEVLVAAVLRKVVHAARALRPQLSHAVINIPACYDQLHRACVVQSARMAGLDVLQLLDRPLAAALAYWETQQLLRLGNTEGQENWMVVELTGSTCEASVLARDGNQWRCLATIGDWRRGKFRWQSRIVEWLASQFALQHGMNVREDLVVASRLQRSAELALDRLALLPKVEIRFEAWGKELRLNLERSHLLQEFRECSSDLMDMPRQVIQRSGIDPKSIRRVLLIGELLGVPELRSLIAKALPTNVAMEAVTQADLARGAALQAQYLMPPGDNTGPSAIPHSVYDIGLLTMSQDNPTGLPKILIPKGSRLPAEFSRTIRFSSQSTRSPALQFVESTQLDGNWHRLGAVEPGTVFPKRLPEQPLQLRLELDLSGLLHCNLTWMAGNQQVVVPNSSHADMDPASVQQWRDWLETIFLCSAPLPEIE